MRRLVIPVAATALVVAAMAYQARTVDPVLCDAPPVVLPELPGYAMETLEPSEAERNVLPADTRIEKRRYVAADGAWHLVSVLVGGQSKNSIHRPELCLPAHGFQMREPREVSVDGVDWRLVKLACRDAPSLGFAYTFYNQDGFRTSSHLKRIFRDVWDRSILCRIDRWVMVTVSSSRVDVRGLSAFLAQLKRGGVL